jgi:hypothetical protein
MHVHTRANGNVLLENSSFLFCDECLCYLELWKQIQFLIVSGTRKCLFRHCRLTTGFKLTSISSYFQLDIKKTACFTQNPIASWTKETSASHEIVQVSRYVSPSNGLLDTRKINNAECRDYAAACRCMLTMYQSQQIAAEGYYLSVVFCLCAVWSKSKWRIFEKFLAFYGTTNFITVFTVAHQRSCQEPDEFNSHFTTPFLQYLF